MRNRSMPPMLSSLRFPTWANIIHAGNTMSDYVKKKRNWRAQARINAVQAHAYASGSLASLVVDTQAHIVLINAAGLTFFKDFEAAFKQDVMGFDASALTQQSLAQCFPCLVDYIDMLPMVEHLPFTADLTLGRHTLQITISAMNPASMGFLGNVIEWRDVTADRYCAKQDQENANLVSAIERVDSVAELGLDGRFLRVNENFCQIMGYRAEELEQAEHSCLILPSDIASGEYADFWAQLKNGQFMSGRYPRLSKLGQTVWLEASYSPIFDCFGEPVKIVEYAIDITSQVAMEQEAATLALVANETDNAVIITDALGRIEYVNPGFTKLTGYALDEVIGKKPGAVLQGPESNPETIQSIRHQLTQQQAFSGEMLNYDKAGNRYWISLNINPILDKEGELLKYVSVQTNITAVKTLHIEVNSRLEAISRSTAVVEMTPDGNIVQANQQACQMLRMTEESLIGCHYPSLIVPSDHLEQASEAPFAQQWQRLLQGESMAGQYASALKDGSMVWMQASFNPIVDIDGNVTRVIQYATEITAQHQQMVALQQAVASTQYVIDGASQGNLSRRIDVEDTSGALADLCAGINALMDRFTEVVSTLGTASHAITEACAEIASGNHELSQRTEKQAANLEETAASMEQLSATVRQNATHAADAFQMADNASKVASKGGEVMGTVVNTMAEINKSARKIEDITSVIDTIAFQTNILALNAAVEAARAGEQGRGFAVVAGEVRNLAQRSATAAKEIKVLINESVTKTAEGTRQVETAGNTMFDIVDSVKNFTDIMNQITTASSQQSDEIDQTKSAINTIDEVTQQNAALVEHAASSAQLLFDEASQLLDIVRAFELDPPVNADNTYSTADVIQDVPQRRFAVN